MAQNDPATRQARARFKEGVAAYDKGQYEKARLAFLQVYALKKHPGVLANLAQSTARAGHPLEAAKYFQQFLKESTTATAKQRLDAENGLAEVRQKLGRIEIVAPSGTEITLDAQERLGTAPFDEPIDVEPGSHALRSSKETVWVDANAGAKVQARFGVIAQPVVAPIATPAASTTPPIGADTRSRHTTLLSPPENMTPVVIGLVVAGAGLVGTILFATFTADAQSEADSVDRTIRETAIRRGFDSNNDGRPDGDGVCSSTNESIQRNYGAACATLAQNNDKVDANSAITAVSVVVFIVGAGTAAGWYLFAPKRDDARKVGGITRPVLTPYVGNGSGGFMFSGSF